MHRSRIALAVAAVLLGACATSSTPAAHSSAPNTGRATAGSDQNRLTQDEISAADLPTAYDLVERLRRAWLRPDQETGQSAVVYLDDQDIGGASKLRDIPSTEVAELRYLPNEQAIRRWGADIKGSVILVIRRR